MEQNDLNLFKIFIIIIKLKNLFQIPSGQDVLGAPWYTGCDPH